MQAQPIDLEDLRAEDLREAARFVEETALEPLADLADEEFPLVVGNIGSGRFFPRESPEQRAALRGLAVLQDAHRPRLLSAWNRRQRTHQQI